MGTDMTTFIEVRVAGEWHSLHLDEAIQKDFRAASFTENVWVDGPHDTARKQCILGYEGRNTKLFNALASLEDWELSIPRVAPLRGLPDDMGETAKNVLEFSQGIHPTWITLAELLAYDWAAHDFGAPDFLRFLDVLKAMGEPEDVRVIFTFFH